MKSQAISLFLILIAPLGLFSQVFTYSGTNVPLIEVMEDLESEYGFLFSYKSGLVESLEISANVTNEDPHRFFQELLRGSGLEANVLEGNFVVITEVNIPGGIQATTDFSVLCGQVVGEDGGLLAGATVVIVGTNIGAFTDENGDFSLRVPTSLDRVDSVRITYLGFRSTTIPAVSLKAPDCQMIQLESQDIVLCGPILIEEYITDGIIYGRDKDVLTIRPASITALPGQTEPDVLRTLQFLPGVSSPAGELSQLYIRGGTPDQNLMLWEGIPMYHTAHYFGMISGFNPYAIGQMDVYRGGFGADQGGRASGLVEMEAQDLNHAETKYGAGVNMLLAHAQGNQIIGDRKASVSWSIRRSIADIWPSPTFNNITQRVQQGILFNGLDPYNLPPAIAIDNDLLFIDGNVKAIVDLGGFGNVSASWFGSKNDFNDLIEDSRASNFQTDSLSISNTGASVEWDINTGNWDIGLLASTSEYQLESAYSLEWSQSNRNNQTSLKTNLLTERQLRIDGTYWFENDVSVQLGYSLNTYDLGFQLSQILDNLPLANQGNTTSALLNTGYAILKSPQQKAFRGELGLRLSHFSPTDSWYPEPRLQLSYIPHYQLTFSLQAGRYRQFLSHLLEFQGANTGIESPIWVLSGTDQIPVIQSDQLQMGLVWEPSSWVIDVQAYWRRMDNLSSLAIGFDGGMGGQFFLGSGSARGMDFLIRKRWRNFRSWISYSLSEVLYDFPEFEQQVFHAAHDQRHQLNIVNQLTAGNFEFSVGWRMNTGIPYTRVLGLQSFIDPNGNESSRPLFDSYHAERLPLQHQLDASVLYHFGPKSSSFRGTIGLSVLNLYNRRNVYDQDVFVDRPPMMRPPRLVTVEKIDLRLTPNAVVRIEF